MFILFPFVHSHPLLTNETQVAKQNTSHVETEVTSELSSPRDDYEKVETRPEVAIAFLRTNGTTYGDTFGNPYGRNLDLPYKNLEDGLSEHPEFKGFSKDPKADLGHEFPLLVQEFYRAKKLEEITKDETQTVNHVPFSQSKQDHIEEIHEKQPDIIYDEHNYGGFSGVTNPGYQTFKPSPQETPSANGFTGFTPLTNGPIYEDHQHPEVKLDYHHEPEEIKPDYHNQPQETEIIQKHIYVHIPPTDSTEVEVTTQPIIRKQKHYKIIFIKAPTQASVKNIILPPEKQEKTLIYVLVKKPDVPKVFPTPAPTVPSKPEVYYIRYGANRGTVHAKIASHLQSLMDLEYNSSDRSEKVKDKSKTEDKDKA